MAQICGVLEYGADDRRDGFIHLSAAHQVHETARKHFSGRTGLVLLSVATTQLGAALVWEPSRGGDLFPHLYAQLPIAAIRWAIPIPLDIEGLPILPEFAFLKPAFIKNDVS